MSLRDESIRDVLSYLSDDPETRPGLDSLDPAHPVWDMANRFHVTDQGDRLEFRTRPYLEELYRFFGGEVSVPPPQGLTLTAMKIPQVGLSTWALCTIFTFAGEYGAGIFYALPKSELRNTFVQTHVNETIRRTARYATRRAEAPGADRLGLKLFGPRGRLVFPSSQTDTDFVAIPGDVGVADEFDRCEKFITLLEDRLSRPESWRLRINVSSPVLKGGRIDRAYKASDQRRWHVPCSRCGHEQVLSWWENVVTPRGSNHPGEYLLRDEAWLEGERDRDIYVFCVECGEPLDRLRVGRWIAMRPEVEKHVGWQFSMLFSSSFTVAEMWAQYTLGLDDPDEAQNFYNRILGEPFDSPGAKINEDLLSHAGTIEPFSISDVRTRDEGGAFDPYGLGCYAGVDVGKVLHVHVEYGRGEYRRKILADAVPTQIEELVLLRERFGLEAIVIDAQPERAFVRDAKDVLNEDGEIILWSCRYADDGVKDIRLIPEEALIVVDRTWALDNAWRAYLRGAVLLPREWRSFDSGRFLDSMTGPTRQPHELRGELRWRWSKEDFDHHRHADTYALLAASLTTPGIALDYGKDSAPDRLFSRGPMASEAPVLGFHGDDGGPGYGIASDGDGDRLF